MLTLCIVSTILLGLVAIITFASAVCNYLTYESKAGHYGLFATLCCALGIVNIWLLYCN